MQKCDILREGYLCNNNSQQIQLDQFVNYILLALLMTSMRYEESQRQQHINFTRRMNNFDGYSFPEDLPDEDSIEQMRECTRSKLKLKNKNEENEQRITNYESRSELEEQDEECMQCDQILDSEEHRKSFSPQQECQCQTEEIADLRNKIREVLKENHRLRSINCKLKIRLQKQCFNSHQTSVIHSSNQKSQISIGDELQRMKEQRNARPSQSLNSSMTDLKTISRSPRILADGTSNQNQRSNKNETSINPFSSYLQVGSARYGNMIQSVMAPSDHEDDQEIAQPILSSERRNTISGVTFNGNASKTIKILEKEVYEDIFINVNYVIEKIKKLFTMFIAKANLSLSFMKFSKKIKEEDYKYRFQELKKKVNQFSDLNVGQNCYFWQNANEFSVSVCSIAQQIDALTKI